MLGLGRDLGFKTKIFDLSLEAKGLGLAARGKLGLVT